MIPASGWLAFVDVPAPVEPSRVGASFGALDGTVMPPRRPGDGGPSRRGSLDDRFPPAAVVGTLFLIGGELMLFGGLLFAFWVLRLGSPVWPPSLEPRLPLGITAVSTLCLLASSGAVLGAREALRRADRARLGRRLGAGALLGGLFLTLQGYEWFRFLAAGFTVTSGTYGALFYTLIGAHALHVGAALAWLATAAWLVRGGWLARAGTAPLRACMLYWHFVVALWPVLYACVYLL